MGDRVRRVAIAVLALSTAVTPGVAQAPKGQPDWTPVGEILRAPGVLNPDGSFKITLLRTEVTIKDAHGVPVPAGAGLNSYAAFAGAPRDATVVGDTCMLEHEVQQVIRALREGGIEVVALHNHMMGESPRLLFLHFQGRGEAVPLARAIRAAWDVLGRAAGAADSVRASARMPEWKSLSEILGRPGSLGADGVYKVTFPREDLKVSLDGRNLPPGVGLASWAAFYASSGLPMVMGDLCATREELQEAIDALRAGGVSITAIHNHTLGGRAEVMFMHFEGAGEAADLARAVRAAWDRLGVPGGRKR